MRHQRPSSASRGATSFQAAGSSAAGRSYGGCVEQAANSTAKLLVRMWRMMRVLNLRVRDRARAFDFVLDLGGAAVLAQSSIDEQLEEHRHEEDGEEGRRHHSTHDARADRAARAGARAGGKSERHHAEDEGERGHQDRTEAQPRRLQDRKSTRLNSSHSSISYAV